MPGVPAEAVDQPGPVPSRLHRRYVTAAGEPLPGVAEFLASDDVAIVLEPVSAFTWDVRASEAAQALRTYGGTCRSSRQRRARSEIAYWRLEADLRVRLKPHPPESGAVTPGRATGRPAFTL